MVDEPSHVVAMEMKAVAVIGAMRQKALIAGVQVYGVATCAARFGLEMLQEQSAEAGAVESLQSDEIVDVEDMAPGESVEEAVASGGGDGSVVRGVNDAIAFGELFAPARDQFVFGEMRA